MDTTAITNTLRTALGDATDRAQITEVSGIFGTLLGERAKGIPGANPHKVIDKLASKARQAYGVSGWNRAGGPTKRSAKARTRPGNGSTGTTTSRSASIGRSAKRSVKKAGTRSRART